MRSSRPTLLRRIVGLAIVAAAGLVTAGLIYGLRSDDAAAPAGVGTTAPTATTRPPVMTGGHPEPAQPAPGNGSPSLDDVLDDLEFVNVAFNAPRTMHLNEPVVIQLLLSGGQTVEQLQKELTALGEQEGEQIRASDTMEAQLTGPGFDIAPVTPAVQLVSKEAVTEWQWEVEPTKTGERRLHLTLSALIDLGGKDADLHGADVRADARGQGDVRRAAGDIRRRELAVALDGLADPDRRPGASLATAAKAAA